MEYKIGQKLLWFRDDNFTPVERVEVVELRSRGQAKLSNGWMVDSDGIAEGTNRVAGGYVHEVDE